MRATAIVPRDRRTGAGGAPRDHAASHSQILPELAELEDAGLLEVVGEGARGGRTHAITDAGREESGAG